MKFASKLSLLFFFVVTLIIGSSCEESQKPLDAELVRNPKSAEGQKVSPMAKIEFGRTEVDFGRLIQGEKATYTFRFKNTGNANLILSKVSADCGCTASTYTTKALKPGEEGTIEIIFDSNGLRGVQNKTVTVLSNTSPSLTHLRVKAQVALP